MATWPVSRHVPIAFLPALGPPPSLNGAAMVNTSTTSVSWKKTCRTWRQRLTPGTVEDRKEIALGSDYGLAIDRIMSRKKEHRVRSTRLIVSEDGTPMTVAMLRGRFDLAREAAGVAKSEFQMRDLRAKAGTDKAESSGDIMQAKDQLGHTTVVMTEQYIRNRKGKKVSPTK
jgi:integrase